MNELPKRLVTLAEKIAEAQAAGDHAGVIKLTVAYEKARAERGVPPTRAEVEALRREIRDAQVKGDHNLALKLSVQLMRLMTKDAAQGWSWRESELRDE